MLDCLPPSSSKLVHAEKAIPYHHRLAPLYIRNSLFSWIPTETERIVVVGVGSNLISGDSLGPFVGTLLHGMYPGHLTTLGNLESPLDAVNLEYYLSSITFPDKSFIIAVDSGVGNEQIQQNIVIRKGPLHPGTGIGNHLPPVGDCHIMGIVLGSSPILQSAIPYTNIHMIYRMATNIAKGISLTIRQTFDYPCDTPLLSL